MILYEPENRYLSETLREQTALSCLYKELMHFQSERLQTLIIGIMEWNGVSKVIVIDITI